MVDMSENLGPTLLIAAVFALTIIAIIVLDRWHRRRIKRIFRSFSEKEGSRLNRESRSVPRVSVPGSLDVLFRIRDDRWLDRCGRVADLSLSGLAVEPDFPLKKIPPDAELGMVEVETPINRFVLEKVRAVRVEHQISKRVLAFKILSVSEENFDEMKRFIVYLDAFSQT
jgi:hypothetical protein